MDYHDDRTQYVPYFPAVGSGSCGHHMYAVAPQSRANLDCYVAKSVLLMPVGDI